MRANHTAWGHFVSPDSIARSPFTPWTLRVNDICLGFELAHRRERLSRAGISRRDSRDAFTSPKSALEMELATHSVKELGVAKWISLVARDGIRNYLITAA